MKTWILTLSITVIRARATQRIREDEAQSLRGSNVAAISSCYYLLQVILLLFVYPTQLELKLKALISVLCRINGIDFEEIKVELAKRQQYSHEFKGLC